MQQLICLVTLNAMQNNKFEQRFRKVEEKALERGVSLKDLSLIEMDILWDEVKKEEK